MLDSLYEGPEDVVFELSVLSGPAVVGVTDTVTVTIADGDTAPTVSFDIADSTVDEGDTANVVVMLSGRSQDAVTVNFMVSGSAMVGADYTTPGTSVTIPANSDRTMITFAIKDESRYDGVTETVILTLTSATGDVTVGATNVHTLKIDDRQNPPDAIAGSNCGCCRRRHPECCSTPEWCVGRECYRNTDGNTWHCWNR